MGYEVLSELSTTDQTIMSAINYHISQSEYVSISELADECDVAKSTIVKLAKKLGYTGYADMRETLCAGKEDEVSDSFLPLNTTQDEDTLDAATRLATLFWDRRHAKHVLASNICSVDAILSAYLARKLAMFGIYAISTYDYASIIAKSTDPGIALFFEHNIDQKAGAGSFVLSAFKPLFKLAQQEGYCTVLITDVVKETSTSQLADKVFRIKPSYDSRYDFFAPRTIVLFELMLSELSRLAASHNEDPASLGENACSKI